MRFTSSSLLSLTAVVTLLISCAPPPQSEPGHEQTPPPPASPTVTALPPRLLPGARRETLASDDPAYFASWWILPGAPALTRQLATFTRTEVNEWLEGQDADPLPDTPAPTSPRPSADDAEFTVHPDLTDAGTDVIGIRMTTSTRVKDGRTDRRRTLWYDARTGAVSTGLGLVTPAGAAELRDATIEQLLDRTDHDSATVADLQRLTPAQMFAPDGAFDSVNFTPDGRLVVEFDDATVASSPFSEVIIDAATVKPWLTPLGRRAQAATADPTPTTVTPTPSPTPKPRPNCAVLKCIALTFDDGPGPYTVELLDTLKKTQARATFFVLGPNVEAHPEIVRRTAAEGHQVGNHSWTHRQFSHLSNEAILDEVDRTAGAVKKATGSPTSGVRPPYGDHNQRVDEVLAGRPHAPVILWDVDTLDWKTRSAEATVAEVQRSAHPGAIVLMHDIHPETVQAVPAIVKWLQQQGYTLVTVDELLADVRPQSGQVFRSRTGG